MSAVPPFSDNAAPKQEWPPLLPAVRRKVQQCYEQGKKLMAQPKYDHDYAHTLLVECVLADPGTIVYVDAFLQNLSRKYNHNKKGASLQFFMNRGPFKRALKAKDWPGVFKASFEILKVSPWDATTHHGLAEACEHYFLLDAAVHYLRMAIQAKPQDPELNRHAARVLGRMGQYDQAISLWGKVAEFSRGDEEADRMVTQLQMEKTQILSAHAEKTRSRPGSAHLQAQVPATSVPRAPLRNMSVQANLQDVESGEAKSKRKEMQLTPAQRLEQAIADDPSYLGNYSELAEMYVREGRPANAERVLSKALSVSGHDLNIQERLEEVQILRCRQQAAIAEKQAQLEPSDESRELAEQMRSTLNRLEMEVFGRRAERYPSEPKWRYELGHRLKQAGNYSEAIKQLQELPTPEAQLELGECLQQLRLFPKAMQAYAAALAGAETAAAVEIMKLALYRSGVLGIALHDAQGAEFLRKLVQMDPSYRDAQVRLDKLGSIGNNG